MARVFDAQLPVSPGRFCRAALIALLLAYFAGLQSASAIAEHPHQNSRAHTHCCAACQIGHLPALQATTSFGIAPPLAEWRSSHEEALVSDVYLAPLNPARAPPA